MWAMSFIRRCLTFNESIHLEHRMERKDKVVMVEGMSPISVEKGLKEARLLSREKLAKEYHKGSEEMLSLS
jgi:hypothetical protein